MDSFPGKPLTLMWPAGYPGTQHPFKIHGVEKSKKFAGHITVKIRSGFYPNQG